MTTGEWCAVAGKLALAVLVMLLVLVALVPHAFAAPPASPYAPGETLAPSCAPGDSNCRVRAPAEAGANADITSILGLTTPLSVLQGGTGLASLVANRLLFATGASSIAQLATSSLGLISTDIAEGVNQYFTNVRADSRINATSSIGTLLAAPNLTTIGTIASGVWHGSAIDASQYLANFGVPFYSFFRATTTDALAEGANRYFTDVRADGRINATSTIGTLLSAPNLATLGTIASGVWHGTAIDASQYLSNFGIPFYQFLHSTTTDALTEGVNKYFTDARADSRINATSTIGTLLSAPNLAAVGTVLSGTWRGNPIDATTYITNLGVPFYSLFHATTTDALAEGTNKYFTDARADSRINATSTIGTLLSAPNLSSIGTVASGVWHGTAIDASQYLSNFGVPFYQFLHSTTTDALTEGVNKYFTNARADARINATSTIGTLFAAANLSTVGTIVSGVWNGTAIDASQYLANVGVPFYQLFHSTTTDALAEGTLHRFYSDSLVGSYISGSSTIPHAVGAAFGNVLAWTGSGWGSRATSTLGISLADTVGTLTNNQLANSAITVNPGTGLTGGATAALGAAVSLALDLAHVNVWTALQQFTRASSTMMSITGPAYFGTTATSTFSSTGDLTLAGIGAAMLTATDGTGKIISSSTPSVGALLATSTTATSTLAGGLAVAGTKLVVDRVTGNVGIGMLPSGSNALAVAGRVAATLGFNGDCHDDSLGLNLGAVIGVLNALTCNQDVAETYGAYEATEPGDVVAFPPPEQQTFSDAGFALLGRSRGVRGETALGVVSTNPGLVFANGRTRLAGANNGLLSATSTVVALSGRVPVRVSLENGPIRAGDELVVSTTTPGALTRATTPGIVLGTALSAPVAVASGTPFVLLFVNRHYSLGIGTTLADSVFRFTDLVTGKLTTHTLCLDDVCVTKEQLQRLLQQGNANGTPAIGTEPQVSVSTTSVATSSPEVESVASSTTSL